MDLQFFVNVYSDITPPKQPHSISTTWTTWRDEAHLYVSSSANVGNDLLLGGTLCTYTHRLPPILCPSCNAFLYVSVPCLAMENRWILKKQREKN
jgi:hypothetical protein